MDMSDDKILIFGLITIFLMIFMYFIYVCLN